MPPILVAFADCWRATLRAEELSPKLAKMMKLMMMMTAVAALTLATGAQAIPLRELIFQTMAQEQQGVLTSSEITQARKLGAAYYKTHGDYRDVGPVAKRSARQMFPTNALKQHEWVLECNIGWMMASEAAFWTP
jgi:hypothetical protein